MELRLHSKQCVIHPGHFTCVAPESKHSTTYSFLLHVYKKLSMFLKFPHIFQFNSYAGYTVYKRYDTTKYLRRKTKPAERLASIAGKVQAFGRDLPNSPVVADKPQVVTQQLLK